MVDSYVKLLRGRADKHPEAQAYGFLRDGEELSETLTYAELDTRARAFAEGLRALVPRAERALLLYPAGLEYPVAFLGCAYAGVTAVPAYPPEPGRAVQALARLHGLVADARADVVLTRDELLGGVRELLGADEGVRACLSQSEVLVAGDPERWQMPEGLPDRVAFLQYTSGSTGEAKGVMVTHKNLLAHQVHSHSFFAQPEGATCVSWLPFYHDMGLIGAMLYPLYCGGRTLFISPTSFIKRPMRWIEAISRHRAEVSTGPNFAYELVAERARPEEVARLDLSCWRLAVMGAEPLRWKTIERFVGTFGPAGFRRSTFMPCFGMAEATLTVSATRLEDEPRMRWFERASLRRRVALDAEPDAARVRAWPMIACGDAMPGHELAIVDPDTRERLPDGRIGEIWLRGPSVAIGYFGAPERTKAAFHATIAGDDAPDAPRWFRTGDLAFRRDGDLFAYGRWADLIRRGDEWLAAHSIESTALESIDDNFVAEAAAITLADPGQPTRPEQFLLVLSARRTASQEVLAEQSRLAAEAVARVQGHAPDQVLCVPLRSVGKTSSGKPRRFRWREAIANQELEILHRWPASR